MARTMFMEQLAQLEGSMRDMAGCVERSLELARKTVETGKVADPEALRSLEFDAGRYSQSVESQCLRILLRQQPVASDLRETSGDLRAVNDFRRIIRQAAEFCRTIDELDGNLDELRCSLLTGMTEEVQKMALLAVQSYLGHDSAKAEQAAACDDVVDAQFAKVHDEVVDLLTKGAADPSAAMSLLMAAKYLERMGDHAENVAGWASYVS